MATIGGLSSSTSSGVNMYGASMKGYGGLATGMDTDSLIEGMTLGTRTKIQNLLKKKDTYQWQMDAYQSVSDSLIKFNKKYLNIADTNSPFRSSFYDKTLATAGGRYSSNVSVSGIGTMLDRMKILEVTERAKDANLNTHNSATDNIFGTGSIDFTNDLRTSTLNGQNFKLQYDNEVLTINMVQGEELKDGNRTFEADYTTPEGITKAVNAKLKATKMSDGNTPWSDKVSMSYDPINQKSMFAAGAGVDETKLSLVKSSFKALELLGYSDADGNVPNDGRFTGGLLVSNRIDKDKLVEITDFTERFASARMTFSYNGTTKSIELPSKSEWMVIEADADPEGALRTYMQGKLDDAFGRGKISVLSPSSGGAGAPASGLAFMTPNSSAILKVTTADDGVLGKHGLFKMDYGVSNRVNTGTNIYQAGLDGLSSNFGAQNNPLTDDYDTSDGYNDASGNLFLKINGVEITGLTVNSSMGDIIGAINSSSAGVKVTYLETADKFTITSTVKGKDGSINIDPDVPGDPIKNFASLLFGNSTVTPGTNAEMIVQYDGGATMKVERDSNSFSLDGTTFTLNEKFTTKTGVDASGNPVYNTDDAISFTTSVDTEKVTKIIGEMIEDYNKMIESVQGYVGTKPDRDYGPLTDDEKEKLSESQIEKLEKKAKEGILFNDPVLRSLADGMRVVFSGVADIGVLSKMGMTVGTSYKDGGKITFDAEKFKSAFLADQETVRTFFTKPDEKDSAGNITKRGGITVRMKGLYTSFANTEGSKKGTLINKAGHPDAPTSVLQNSLKKLMDEIDVDVKQLKKKLQVEIDRYTKQFTSLEQLVSQMNSQSSQLTSMLGG